MKLVIQIPCLNEERQLARTFHELPHHVRGVDEIEIVVVDDGSADGTAELARKLGVHHVVRFTKNRGLANAFMAGIDAALRLGADIVVNTDADNQYPGSEIGRLVSPIVEGRADIVVGDRQTDAIAHFSPFKRVLQRWGSRVVRNLSGTEVADSPSGFRAFSRAAAERLCVHNRFTYTLETVIQAGRLGLCIENVKITTNPKTRESRLFGSAFGYVRRAGPVILRAYAMYRPVQVFALIALCLFGIGFATLCRFLVLYLEDPGYSGYIQSVVVGCSAIVLGFVVVLAAMLAELVASNRRLLEEVLVRTRRLEAEALGVGAPPRGVEATGAPTWRATPAVVPGRVGTTPAAKPVSGESA
jgi:glycosyltransferase involved in cell wall biosynthesis